MRGIATFLVGLILAGPLQAEALSLDAISGYFNALKSAQTDFTQINDDGSVSSGKLYIRRPGRMRFEYDPPDSTLVIAAANAVYIIDSKSNTPPETYPLRRTPLSLILSRNVDLERADMVAGYDSNGTETVVAVRDPEHPEYGSMEMVFSSDPVALRQWVIHDEGGGQTKVILGELSRSERLPNALFDATAYGPKIRH